MQGQIEQPLNATGRAQAARNGQRLRKALGRDPSHLDFVASPLQRTRLTMEIILREIECDPEHARFDPRLREISFGNWEGKTMEEIRVCDPKGYAAREQDKWGWAPPGGESYEMLHRRIGGWLAEVTGDTVVVSHGGVMRALRKHLEDIDPHVVPHVEIPQDRVMVCKNGLIGWLD